MTRCARGLLDISCQPHRLGRLQNAAIAQQLLEGIGRGQDPAEIATLFDADLVFEVQGDDGVLPWIGRKTGRQAAVS